MSAECGFWICLAVCLSPVLIYMIACTVAYFVQAHHIRCCHVLDVDEFVKKSRVGSRFQIHHLKILPEFYSAVLDGTKTFEVRRADRPFRVGDVVLLEEYCDGYTGRSVHCLITYILSDVDYVHPGFVVLGIYRLANQNERLSAGYD